MPIVCLKTAECNTNDVYQKFLMYIYLWFESMWCFTKHDTKLPRIGYVTLSCHPNLIKFFLVISVTLDFNLSRRIVVWKVEKWYLLIMWILERNEERSLEFLKIRYTLLREALKHDLKGKTRNILYLLGINNSKLHHKYGLGDALLSTRKYWLLGEWCPRG